jgi:hypothetical protein
MPGPTRPEAVGQRSCGGLSKLRSTGGIRPPARIRGSARPEPARPTHPRITRGCYPRNTSSRKPPVDQSRPWTCRHPAPASQAAPRPASPAHNHSVHRPAITKPDGRLSRAQSHLRDDALAALGRPGSGAGNRAALGRLRLARPPRRPGRSLWAEAAAAGSDAGARAPGLRFARLAGRARASCGDICRQEGGGPG